MADYSGRKPSAGNGYDYPDRIDGLCDDLTADVTALESGKAAAEHVHAGDTNIIARGLSSAAPAPGARYVYVVTDAPWAELRDGDGSLLVRWGCPPVELRNWRFDKLSPPSWDTDRQAYIFAADQSRYMWAFGEITDPTSDQMFSARAVMDSAEASKAVNWALAYAVMGDGDPFPVMDIWPAAATVAEGEKRIPTAPDGKVIQVQAGGAGTTGASEPDWSSLVNIGDTLTDNTVTWELVALDGLTTAEAAVSTPDAADSRFNLSAAALKVPAAALSAAGDLVVAMAYRRPGASGDTHSGDLAVLDTMKLEVS